MVYDLGNIHWISNRDIEYSVKQVSERSNTREIVLDKYPESEWLSKKWIENEVIFDIFY